MVQSISLDTLWKSAVPQGRSFSPELISDLPQTARRYLEHTIAPGAPLAAAVRLRMQGEIKLKGWCPFQAEQVICLNRGMIWRATAWIKGLPISGFDRIVDGTGSMQWKLLGLIPVMVVSGEDITRSAIGRMQGESVWLPSVFCDPALEWTALDESHVQTSLNFLDEPTDLILTIGDTGKLEQICFQRWGSPAGETPGYAAFGGYMEQEGTFAGYTVPTKFRVGWYFGSDRFESEGEFFRATIDRVTYR
ncbi:DUF6920 family protein [Egbenema bharatensis]|uniref:DUF6920 family protein n=1 Tax=Egbenema bharatensis TaxID=3463334 RepID=UPI003A8A4950